VENGEKQEEMLYVKGPQMEFQIFYIRSFNSGVLIDYICVEKTLGYPFIPSFRVIEYYILMARNINFVH